MHFRGNARPTTIATVVVLGLAALVFASWGATRWQTDTSPTSSAVTSSFAPAEETSTTVAWLGDSYTAGAGTDYSISLSRLATKSLCWRGSYDGEGGTGYVNQGPGPDTVPFGDRVAKVIQSKPDVVIVQGSTNDPGTEQTQAAANAVFAAIKQGDPNAFVIAIGPTAPPAVGSAQVFGVRDAIKSAAAANGVLFLDPIENDWLPTKGTDNYASDGIHPSPSGHRTLAKDIHDAIIAAKVPVASCAAGVS